MGRDGKMIWFGLLALLCSLWSVLSASLLLAGFLEVPYTPQSATGALLLFATIVFVLILPIIGAVWFFRKFLRQLRERQPIQTQRDSST